MLPNSSPTSLQGTASAPFVKAFRTIALVGKYPTVGSAPWLAEIATFLHTSGRTVLIEEQTALLGGLDAYTTVSIEQIGLQADAAILVGGDGTMLGLARQLAAYSVPLIGINQGRLGFMTDIPLEHVMPVLSDMLNGKVESEQRSLLQGEVVRDGQTIYQALAFNDVVVSRGAGAGMLELRVEVDGRFMYNQRSDGLIIATPTGSTAYALSAGGPLLHPSLGGVVMVPIAPHALSNRPIVLPDSSEILIEVINGRETSVNFDMQSLASLQLRDRIVVRRSQHNITFLHPAGWSYFATLREKLHWNEYPSVEGQLK
jgi:NAD+ kinase